MNEILIYLFRLFLTSFPYWILSYYPFGNYLRFSIKNTLLITLAGEFLALSFIGLMCYIGIPIQRAEFLMLPVCLIVDLITMKVQPSILYFFFIFIMDYTLLVKGIAFFIFTMFEEHASLMSATGTLLHLLVFALTVPLIFLFMRRTANRMLQVNAPDLWRFFWIIPAFTSLLLLIFTGQRSPDEVGRLKFLIARIGGIFCVFVVYYVVFQSLENLKQKILLERQFQADTQLLSLQKRQYQLLLQQMEDTRAARHNLRQHLILIQSYLNDENNDALRDYLTMYSQNLPSDTVTFFCENYTVNTIMNYYSQEASLSGVVFNADISAITENFFVSDPDLCVLLGNLLENALEAEKNCLPTDSEPPFIKIRAVLKNEHTFLLIVDNGPTVPPVMTDNVLYSTKHPNEGIGTLSVKNIASHYNGYADFLWENDTFYASVMLCTPCTSES